MRKIKLTRSMQFGLGSLGALLITFGFWLGGLFGNAPDVTAYATTVLAVGTSGLAVGAIGTYVEQRKTNQQQAMVLERSRINEIAQVLIERFMDASNFGAVRIRNHTSRAIRNVYVWIEVRGMKGRYHLGLKKKVGAGTDEMWRGMEHVPRGAPGGDVTFEQIRFMHDNQPISAMRDSDITAWAEFEDQDGQWWRCNENGEVNPAPVPPPVTVQAHPISRDSMDGLGSPRQ